MRDEVVTFIDGGVGQVQLAGQIPILLRVGSYAVRTGERDWRAGSSSAAIHSSSATSKVAAKSDTISSTSCASPPSY